MRNETQVSDDLQTLRQRLIEEYNVDLLQWHEDWLRLLRASLRHGPEDRLVALEKAEHDAVVCIGLVEAMCHPMVFRSESIVPWHTFAREYGQHAPTIDAVSLGCLARLGYARLRAWRC